MRINKRKRRRMNWVTMIMTSFEPQKDVLVISNGEEEYDRYTG